MASDVALTAGGTHAVLVPGAVAHYQLPSHARPELRSFFSRYSELSYPDSTVTVLPRGRIHAFETIISPDGKEILRDLSIDNVRPADDHYMIGAPLGRARRLHGTTLCVSSDAGNNYYHWLINELPRLLALGGMGYDHLICSPMSELRRNALEFLGFDLARVVPRSTENNDLRCDTLVVPSYLGWPGRPSPAVADLLRSATRDLVPPAGRYPDKILLSRRGAVGRKIVGETELLKRLAPHGYEAVDLEGLSWEEQIGLFYHTKEIIAPHGAGLANLVFSANQPTVIEVFNSKYVHWCYWHLAEMVGARYAAIAAPINSPVEHNRSWASADIDVDPAQVIRLRTQLQG